MSKQIVWWHINLNQNITAPIKKDDVLGSVDFYLNDEKIGQGRENAKQYLISHPEVMEEVEKLVREKAIIN